VESTAFFKLSHCIRVMSKFFSGKRAKGLEATENFARCLASIGHGRGIFNIMSLIGSLEDELQGLHNFPLRYYSWKE
jgi:hypothetical protein